MATNTPDPHRLTPRNYVNLGLAIAAGLVIAACQIFWPDDPRATLTEAMAGAFLVGLVTPGSPVGRALDRLAGQAGDVAPASDGAAEAVREVLERRPLVRRPAPRKLEGSAALDVLGFIVSIAVGVGLLIFRH